MNNKIIVIHHSADFDGLFCREIARKFLPEAELIGWDYGQPKIPYTPDATIYILDLSPECLDGLPPHTEHCRNIIWIDHHKSAIEKWPSIISGLRIDGVAACRLAWQWFAESEPFIFQKRHFVDRQVKEPLAVQLAGEYDIWDKREPKAEVFQFSLRSVPAEELDWNALLAPDEGGYFTWLLDRGFLLRNYQQQNDAGVVNYRSFMVEFEGLKFLALNTARCNSLTFAAKDVPETGHDALMGFYFNGSKWSFSLYHANHRKDLDLSQIAVKYGGGGHRGACGFKVSHLPDCVANIDTHH